MDVTAARRARLVARHHLAGTAPDPVAAADAVLALHATDPATVYLSVLARCHHLTRDDVAAALYSDRALVRMMAMRRTVFVVPSASVPVVHHAASIGVAATMRKRLTDQLATLPTDPPVGPDVAGWLASVEASVDEALRRRGRAPATVLSTDEPRLRTAVLPVTDKAYDTRRTVTAQVLGLMAAEGRIVRSAPLGSWLARQHAWEPAQLWWPGGIEAVDDPPARLVEAYLRRFGPATAADVQWWTGWTAGATRRALAALAVEDSAAGLVLAGDRLEDDDAAHAPVAALLPALDPTPMGWKERDWFLPADAAHRALLYDRSGNVGPTVWWGGEVVGGWAVRPGGEVVQRMFADRGASAAEAVAAAAARVQLRLDGAAVVPSFPTPLETSLRKGER